MDKFAKYKKPDLVTFSVEGEHFIVDLPTRWNKPYSRAWQEELASKAEVNAEGKVDTSKMKAADFINAKRAAFIEHCIVESPIPTESLAVDYPLILDAIIDAAETMADEAEKKVEDLVGKLLPTSSGNKNGETKSSSIDSSKKQAA